MSHADTLARVRRLVDLVVQGDRPAGDGDRLGADLQMDRLDIVELEIEIEDEFSLEERSLAELLDSGVDMTVADLAKSIDDCRAGVLP